MLTGIMAIFEMGLSLTGRSLLPTQQDPYFKTPSTSEMDRALLELLDSSTDVTGIKAIKIGKNQGPDDFCNKLVYYVKNQCANPPNSMSYCRFNGIIKRDLAVEPGKQFKNNGFCAWRFPPSHRVLYSEARTVVSGVQQFYSCVLEKSDGTVKDRCDFEESK